MKQVGSGSGLGGKGSRQRGPDPPTLLTPSRAIQLSISKDASLFLHVMLM